MLTSYGDGDDKKEGSMKKGVFYLAISTVGYVTYVIVVRWNEVDGWSAILPQAIGMFLAALLLRIYHEFGLCINFT
ncbi:GRP family sugar transporter [Peribacillus simplex]|uniref:GRP family sugar transporter n=2 Tax=Peribacillus TaxID=2675229 RepID=A0AA90P7Q0_9BACI|nr:MULTISPECIES: GRP family sugar transporter [Peribacillus]MDP1417724.1 GRP family sugar transporter [Peribacillus simplex]MDP1450379.1 GRP family sugar transporter [Peribacillus frigoritolerans]